MRIFKSGNLTEWQSHEQLWPTKPRATMFVKTATTRGVLRSLRTYVKHRKYYADYMEGRNVQPSNVELIVSSLYSGP